MVTQGGTLGEEQQASGEAPVSCVPVARPAPPCWSPGAVALLKHFVLERRIFNVHFVLWKFHTCIRAVYFGHSHILILPQLLPLSPPRSPQVPPSVVSFFSSSPTFCLLVSPHLLLPFSLLFPLFVFLSLWPPPAPTKQALSVVLSNLGHGALTTWIHTLKEMESPSPQESSAISGFSLGVGAYWIPCAPIEGNFEHTLNKFGFF